VDAISAVATGRCTSSLAIRRTRCPSSDKAAQATSKLAVVSIASSVERASMGRSQRRARHAVIALAQSSIVLPAARVTRRST
jgi:hypothetical protein